MPDIIEFVKLATAAEEVTWHPRHLYRVLNESSYCYFDPRPAIRRLGGRGNNVLIRSEWEPFKQRLAEEGLKRPPKNTKLSQARHRARLERERERAGEAV